MENRKKYMFEQLLPFFAFIILTVVRYMALGHIVIFSDSEDYINCSNLARPLYPAFLTIMRLFGDNYLFIAGIIQNLVLAVSCFMVYRCVKKHFSYNGLFWSALLIVILFVPHLVNAIGSQEYKILSDAILSEGLSYSMYNFYFVSIVNASLERNWKWYWISCLSCLMVMLVRPQLLFVIVIQMCVLIYRIVRDKNKWTYIISLPALLIVFYVLIMLYSNYMSTYESSFGINGSFAIRTYYTSDQEDQVYLCTEDAITVFSEMESLLEVEGIGYEQWGESIIQNARYQEECYTTIDNYQDIVITKLANQKGIFDEKEIDIFGKMISAEINSKLSFKHLNRQLYYYFNFVCQGMIRSISIWRPLFVFAGILAYFLFFVMMILHIRKKGLDKLTIVNCLLCLMIFGNVFASSLAIMCLSRYMIYNMALFYIIFGANVIDLVNDLKQKKNESNPKQY